MIFGVVGLLITNIVIPLSILLAHALGIYTVSGDMFITAGAILVIGPAAVAFQLYRAER
jgi:hypothetical protein